MNSTSKNSDSDVKKFLSFSIDKQKYAIDIMKIREIREWEETTSIPESPSYMIGVVDIRGKIVPIFDIKNKFGNGATDTTNKNAVIVLKFAGKMIGILVHSVSDIIEIKPEEINEAPSANADIETKYIVGIFSTKTGMVILLDAEKIFDAELVSQITKDQ